MSIPLKKKKTKLQYVCIFKLHCHVLELAVKNWQKALFTPNLSRFTEMLYCKTCERLHKIVTFIVSYKTP